jgi:hypothetical protein
MVGQDTADTDFDVLEETGGAKTHSHSGTTGGQSQTHSHSTIGLSSGTLASSEWAYARQGGSYYAKSSGNASQDHSHTFSMGTGVANSTVQPFIVVKMWKRTA